jgi:putative PIN family toxin of toxin-antitoxin system
MKIFFDTNVLIAAFISHGACNELIEHCMSEYAVYTSKYVLDELADKLRKKFKYPENEIAEAQKIILTGASLTEEIPNPPSLSRDKDDNHIIAAALKINADCIISGDKDLLDLKTAHGIPVINPKGFWKFEEDFKAKN